MNKLIIASFRDGILSVRLRDEKPIQLNFEKECSSLVGNLYVARVKKIQKNLECAFLDIGESLPAYYAYGYAPNPVYLDYRAHEVLKEGDEILVKIKKDPHKTKGATAVSNFPERHDKELIRLASFQKAPSCFKRSEPFWLRLSNQFAAEVLQNQNSDSEQMCSGEILTDRMDVYRTLTGEEAPKTEAYQEKLPEAFQAERPVHFMKNKRIPVRFHAEDKLSLTAIYSLETVVKEATERKVWLPSGGYLMIDTVEAMTVIDVNSGKNIKGDDRNRLIRSTDDEAASEVMRQIRLRNISGIIIVDFINLKAESDRRALFQKLKQLAALDPIKTTILDITKLNLVEIIREKGGQMFCDQLLMGSKNPSQKSLT